MRRSALLSALLTSLCGCFPTYSAPDVVPVSDLMVRADGGSARTPLFAVVMDRFRDERSSRSILGQYDRGGRGGFFGTVTIVPDRDITAVFEDLVKGSLERKGILEGPSPLVLSGTIRESGVGATPDSKALRAEVFLELSVVDSSSGARLWQKSFLGSATGTDPKETLALAFQDLAGTVDRDDSLFALRRDFLASGGKVPQAAPASASRAPKPIVSDVDEPPDLRLPPDHHLYAVVIGIERYRQDLPRADFAGRDARTMAAYLAKMGYPGENIVTLIDDHAAKSDLEKYLEQWLPANVGPDSSVFVYYSGHGAPNVSSGDAYLVPYDGDPSFIETTGFPLKRLYASLGKLPAKEVVVALDSCFSGAGGRSVLAKGARPLVLDLKTPEVPPGVTVLSASSGEQASMSDDESAHGLFTYFLLKGLKGGDGLREDGSLDVPKVFAYLKPRVQSVSREKYHNEQTPQLLGATGH